MRENLNSFMKAFKAFIKLNEASKECGKKIKLIFILIRLSEMHEERSVNSTGLEKLS